MAGRFTPGIPESLLEAPAAAFERLNEPVEALVGSFARLDGLFHDFERTWGRFTELFAPGVMFAFNLEMRNLSATIGVALTPMFQKLTEVVRDLGGAILPLMQRIGPILGQMANVMGNALLTAVNLLTTAFEAVMPVIQFLTDLLDTSFQILRVVFAVLTAIIGTAIDGFKVFVKTLFEMTGLSTLFNILGKAVQSLAAAFIRAATTILSILPGGNEILDRLERSLSPGRGATAVPWSPQIMRPEQIAHDIAQAAYAASGGAEQTTNDILREILTEIRDARRGGGSAAMALINAPLNTVANLRGSLNAGDTEGALIHAGLGAIGPLGWLIDALFSNRDRG